MDIALRPQGRPESPDNVSAEPQESVREKGPKGNESHEVSHRHCAGEKHRRVRLISGGVEDPVDHGGTGIVRSTGVVKDEEGGEGKE
jgi:hypothetical protein